jgi:hypothetical protein
MDNTGVTMLLASVPFAVWYSVAVNQKHQARLGLRLSGLERQMGALLAHHGIEVPEPLWYAALREHIRERRKIEAIKLWRPHNPQDGLEEAKAAVDAFVV